MNSKTDYWELSGESIRALWVSLSLSWVADPGDIKATDPAVKDFRVYVSRETECAESHLRRVVLEFRGKGDDIR